MRAGRVPICALTLLGVSSLVAEQRPLAVSPGDPTELLLVEDRCPTFSWSAIEGADSYQIVVYGIGDAGEQTAPIIRRTFEGSVFSWTPSLVQCLQRGGKYAWSVRQGSDQEAASWSEPSFFQVSAGPSEEEFERAWTVVKEYLDSLGVATDRVTSAKPLEAEDPSRGRASLLGTNGVGTTSLSVDGGVAADAFTGDGSTLTAVNADLLDGMDSTAFTTGPHTTDTNAATLCSAGAYLDGNGSCVNFNQANVAMKNSAAGSQSFDSGTLYLDYVNNRVGISNTSPSRKLDVSGGVEVTSQYFYAEPRTDYHWALALDFQRTHNSSRQGWRLRWPTAWEQENNEATDLFAPVHLPNGAVVTRVDCYYYDTSPHEDISLLEITWGRRPQFSNLRVLTPEGSFSQGFPGLDDSDGQADVASITGLSTTIDNQNNAYGLSVELDSTGVACCANDPLFFGCRLTYNYSTAGS